MALPTQNVEIIIEGLSQKQDGKSTPQGRLILADNVEFNKMGRLNKRRGYRRVQMISADIEGGSMLTKLTSKLATLGDELVVFSDQTYSVASPDGVGTVRFVPRGPVIRGAYRLRTIVGGQGSSTT